MPINGVLDLQRRDTPLGEVRTGTSVEVAGKSYRRPVRLETFRFTTGSEHCAKVIAAKYGGEVTPWSQRKGKWEVTTGRSALDVWVPPRGEAVDANMELWDGAKRLRKCDGLNISRPVRKPCMCPQPDDRDDPLSVEAARGERLRLAAMKPPQACSPVTRVSVTIPDLPGLTGVWRLRTGSENAAVEMTDSGDAMAIAREGGVYLPAVLLIDKRFRVDDGKPYFVLVLQIGVSLADLAQHALPAGAGGLLSQLQGAGGNQRMAIAAAARQDGDLLADLVDDDTRRYKHAQSIADRARETNDSNTFRMLVAEMKDNGLEEVFVCEEDDRENGVNGQLEGFLRDEWDRKGGRS